jgi:hypothetical protein
MRSCFRFEANKFCASCFALVFLVQWNYVTPELEVYNSGYVGSL